MFKLQKMIRLVVFGFMLLSQSALAQISIDTSFSGSNIVFEQLSGDTVHFKPDLRDTEGDWFYWYFRAVSNKPKTWYFKSTQPNAMTGLGAVFSTDGGKEWQWIPRVNHHSEDLFSFTFTEHDQAIRFALAPPYTEANFADFIKTYENDNRLKASVLCTSNKGREVEKLLISQFDNKPKSKLLIVARAHACEMMSSYVLEGIISSLLGSAPEMKLLLEQSEIQIIPFIDKDGVENGDQGKNRLPRDHNRDYNGESIYATTKTLRETVPKWVENHPWVGIDLHNPWVKGEGNEWAYIVGNSDKKIEKAQRKFAEILIAESRGSIPLKMDNLFLAYGTSWNTGNNYSKGWSFSRWAASFADKGMKMSTTLEFPYALAYGKQITPDKARAFGEDFIFALAKFMEEHVH